MESPETGNTAYIREIVNVKQMLVDMYAIWLVFLLAVASFMSVPPRVEDIHKFLQGN